MPPVAAAIAAISASIAAATATVAAVTGLSIALAQLAVITVIQFAASFVIKIIAGSPSGAEIEAAAVTVRITEPLRWLSVGLMRQGGGVVFGEFDNNGNFWFVIVHSDSILSQQIDYYFDDIKLFLDSSGNVLNAEFCLQNNKEKDPYPQGQNGTASDKLTFFNIQTTTYSYDNPTPPAISALSTAFPTKWTSDHKLVGTTYSVVKCNALDIEHRYKIYKWRGAFGLGEPALSIAGEWNKAYDPRDVSQSFENPSTWLFTKNPVLIWAWFRTSPFGRNKPASEINWGKVAEQADICDQTVVGVYGSQPRYECGTAIPDNKQRIDAEKEILASCDGIIHFDDQGRAWSRVGYYEAATLALSRNRDIIAMESVDVSNVEDQKQGVIVRYMDVEGGFVVQPSAPWRHPTNYIAGSAASYEVVTISTCQNHNQAMRLAKIIGERSQSEYRIAPTTGLRGLRARDERIVDINYDNTFAGEHEIVTPVEIDSNGLVCGFGAVPINPDRFDLLTGEELAKPVIDGDTTTSAPTLTAPTFTASFVRNRIEASFTAPTRLDVTYQFQFSVDQTTPSWSNMTVEMSDLVAFTVQFSQGADYIVRGRSVSSSGSVSAWSSNVSISSTIYNLSGTPVTTASTANPYLGFTISPVGGTSPFYFVDIFNRLPDGITINSETGVVSGTATTVGSYLNILIRVQDGTGAFVDFPEFNIEVT